MQNATTGRLMKKIQCQLKSSEIEPPKIGPRIGATTTVMLHRPSAMPTFSGGKMRTISVCDIGMIGPPLRPWKMRNTISASRLRESPQSRENSAKPRIAVRNTRTAPKRAASQPESGTQIASATE